MFKHFCLQLFMLFTVSLFGQEITFQKNTSYAARKLKLIQKLNASGDSLILESEKKQIRQVDILNDTYLESIDVNSNAGKINLKKLPLGNYVVQANLGRHWIVMYLEKKEPINASLTETKVNESKDENVIKNAVILEDNPNEVRFKENTLYWVVYESNSPFSSNKTMGLKYFDEIQDLISKIKLELKSEVGQYNKLFVYEIYNRKKFMKRQLRNRKYYKSKKSKFFNVSPIYTSEEKEDIIKNSNKT
ncbi:hypothetical protein [uncultured Psychroserpens sp.]|uniref:hypothetical protein n=1 Tax=uncultured Psychroserpens sp. TaxID=255436 RepID=UPI00261A113C|nr:hypothetical protein [uncultured Psychroserpens sp.]